MRQGVFNTKDCICCICLNITYYPISCAKVSDTAPLDTCSLLGCGVATGLGAVWNTCDVEGGASVAVFGLGAVGLSVIQGAKMRGAKRIFAIDTNPDKFRMAIELGATDCVNPKDHDKPIQQVLVEMTKWGIDYTFDATGNTDVMTRAAPSSRRRERLFTRVSLWAGDARCTRVGPPGVGRVVRDRRRGGGQGDQHPPLPAGDRPKVGGHRLWRLQEPVRGAAASSTGYERGVGGVSSRVWP